ncbi:hypothetical protein AA0119_g10272 [Alternaria tenuissima]|uniref:Heterokaryon incompatibility domain-containing protein n=1 Tax=Alternaria tenuissima TaxID=119927 RepID=A0ABY0G176_9PLEO|nr:hypothetical protein AA0119_g10272 [Alternaria tenuissima]
MIADNSGASGRLHCDLRRDKSTSLGPTPLPPFNYEPLPDRCIRVLELQPGERADPFRGRFTIISIDGEDKFDALSYMWGDASPVDYIIFDGAAIPVAWNLARALEYLRDQQGSEVHRIWIDAVCINQKDDKERGRQVAMMRSVYNKADCVRIWINAPDLEEESKAVAALKSFELGAEGLNFNLGAEELNFGLGDDIKFWEPVKPIFKNEYWNRLWIQQEVMNAQRLVLHCMNIAVLGTNFFQFRKAIEYLTHAALIKSDQTAWYQIISTLQIVDLADRDILIDMLSGTFHLNSSRIHDRLYAIMHLADDFQENDIEADYNKTASQIMLDAADHHIRLHRNIRFLDRSFRSDFDKIGYLEHNSECSFPTWVPRRWLGSNPYGQPMGSAQESRGHPHEAAVNEQLDKKKLFTTCAPDSVDMTHMRLRVRGMKVGEIRTVLSLPIQRVADGMTVAQFWSSSLGQHIGSYLCREERQIPLGIVQALSRRWPNENFNYEDAVSGLMWFYDCSTRPDLADRRIGIVGQLIDALLAPLRDHINGSAAVRATTHIVLQLRQRKCILTGKDQFGLVPECNISAEDEIWMLLGHPTPCVLRKQPNGTYEYICNARIPVLMDDIVGHIDIRRFSTKAVPGEQIGEWTIEDIELI